MKAYSQDLRDGSRLGAAQPATTPQKCEPRSAEESKELSSSYLDD